MGGGHVSRPDFGMPQPDPACPLTEFYLLLQHALDAAGSFALPALYARVQAPARWIDPDEAREYLTLSPTEREGDTRLLAPGNLRIRKKGSAGGHNGIKDIIAKTGTDQFARVKVGVGEKPAGWDLADHVLGRFSPEDREKFDDAVKEAVDAVTLMVQDRTDEAMNRYNRKK